MLRQSKGLLTFKQRGPGLRLLMGQWQALEEHVELKILLQTFLELSIFL